MTLCFTPVKGKRAFLRDWQHTKLTEAEARRYPGATGVGLVHSLSNTVGFDFDDWELCVADFKEKGRDLPKIIEGHCTIASPKPNRRKIICKMPEGYTLTRTPIGTHLDLRAGDVHDLWHDSEYPATDTFPAGGRYTLKNTAEPKDIPQVLLDFWLYCEKKKLEIQTNGTHKPMPIVAYVGSNRVISVVHVFNMTYNIEEIMIKHGFIQKGKAWMPPGSESGSAGVNLQPSYVNPWYVAYTHNASAEKIHARCVDAFDIDAQYSYPEESDIEKAKLRHIADQSRKLWVDIDDETGEVTVL